MASDVALTPDSLKALGGRLTQAAQHFPTEKPYDCAAFACTSAAATLGSEHVGDRIRAGVAADAVTDPVAALIAACREMGVTRLGFLSPYLEVVSTEVRGRLSDAGIETPIFGSFDEPIEANVARIEPSAIVDAVRTLNGTGDIDAVFISCTNLFTLPVLAILQDELGKPVLSSNSVLAWHMLSLSASQFGRVKPDALVRQTAIGNAR